MSPKPYPYNPCSLNLTHHANKVIIRVSQALSVKSVQSVFKKHPINLLSVVSSSHIPLITKKCPNFATDFRAPYIYNMYSG